MSVEQRSSWVRLKFRQSFNFYSIQWKQRYKAKQCTTDKGSSIHDRRAFLLKSKLKILLIEFSILERKSEYLFQVFLFRQSWLDFGCFEYMAAHRTKTRKIVLISGTLVTINYFSTFIYFKCNFWVNAVSKSACIC